MHTAQDGEPAGSLSYETDPLVRIDLTTYTGDIASRIVDPAGKLSAIVQLGEVTALVACSDLVQGLDYLCVPVTTQETSCQ